MEEWETAAQELDVLEGNDRWKDEPSTSGLNIALVESRLNDLDSARSSRDIRAMLYLIRTALSRDLGGMGGVGLYRHSHIGTKRLIERYVDSAIQTVESLVRESALSLPDSMSSRDILDGLLFARQSFGRSALLLSGGATFGMMHIGVLKALFNADLLPRIVSGASAGSIVCAVLCTHTDEEIPTILEEFPYGDLDVFEAVGVQDNMLLHLRRLLTEGSWSDIKNLTRVMRGLLGDLTFQEAYNRTRRILNITVSTESVYELPRLLNYVTAPNVMIWSAVAASCSVPFVFTAASLLVKDPVTGEHAPWNPSPQRWIDGSVDNDLPMARLAEMFNVNHFIVSQVNPHVVPFLAKDDHLIPTEERDRIEDLKAGGRGPDWLYVVTSLAKDEALHRMQFLAELGIFPNLVTKLRSILSQKYSGDINILPEIAIQDLPRILSNPNSEFMLRCCLAGERATWPKMSRIRDRCAIELALDRAVHALRARVVFSESQVDLRRLAVGPVQQPWPDTPAGEQAGAPRNKEKDRQPIPSTTRCGQRRGSGSSVQLLARHRRMLQDTDVTDDETEEEERLEMLRWSAHVASTLPRKPSLRRAARSQLNVHLNPVSLPTPAATREEEQAPFDFSRPILPTQSEVAPSPDGQRTSMEAWAAGPSTSRNSDICSSRAAAMPPMVGAASGGTDYLDGDYDIADETSSSDPDPYSHAWDQITSMESDVASGPKSTDIAPVDELMDRPSSHSIPPAESPGEELTD